MSALPSLPPYLTWLATLGSLGGAILCGLSLAVFDFWRSVSFTVS